MKKKKEEGEVEEGKVKEGEVKEGEVEEEEKKEMLYVMKVIRSTFNEVL